MWYRFGEEPFVLPPAQAAVFRWASTALCMNVGFEPYEEDCSGDMGVLVFDELSQRQKQAAILHVARAMLTDAEPPKITAWLAGTIDAVYRQLEAEIHIEIDTGEESGQGTTVRRLTLAALQEIDYWRQVNDSLAPGEEPAMAPLPDSRDYSEWNDLVEALRVELLEDYDFDMAPDFLDLPPQRAARLKKQMNIRGDYFTAVIDDPSAERLESIREELCQLLAW